MPKRAVEPITAVGDGISLALARKGAHHRDHLAVVDARFRLELIVADAGVGIADLHHAMEDEMSVLAPVERDIKPFQLFGRR